LEDAVCERADWHRGAKFGVTLTQNSLSEARAAAGMGTNQLTEGDIMIRNLKALGLALVAVLALGATMASSASATDFTTVDGAATTATLTGTSTNNVLKVTTPGTRNEVGKFECTTSSFTATAEENSSTITATPTYTGRIGVTPHGETCSSSFGVVTVDMNGCDYVLSGETANEHGGSTFAEVWLECEPGKEIDITGACRFKIPAQTPTEGGVLYTNQEDGDFWDILVDVEMTGITATPVHSFACTIAHATHGWVGDYTGTVTMKGYKDTGTHTHSDARVGVTVSTESDPPPLTDVVTLDGEEQATLTGTSHDNVFKVTTPVTRNEVGKFECTKSSLTATAEENS
jgi:hypothetical protein